MALVQCRPHVHMIADLKIRARPFDFLRTGVSRAGILRSRRRCWMLRQMLIARFMIHLVVILIFNSLSSSKEEPVVGTRNHRY